MDMYKLKSIIIAIKNSLDRVNCRIEMIEERVSEL